LQARGTTTLSGVGDEFSVLSSSFSLLFSSFHSKPLPHRSSSPNGGKAQRLANIPSGCDILKESEN
jgi:hypothetical protein